MSCHKCHMVISYDKSHDRCGKVVHRPYSNCISSGQEMHEDSIEFSLSSADKGAVGFIPAQELAILTWLPTDLPNISANDDCLKMWLVLIKRSFQGLSGAIETVGIVEELVEIGPNEVCDNI